ncbi:hypothetical protein G7Y89_g217 [Cudoniella acicularis]|uniref:Heterokaryon incompatibility domain-containing protein n=1 Tax=Cudoniella acicularis TaxID=354080 RepID=A0A8H4S0B0_9HELO|nr:hypothetical protein G7Y89_g217 [Cudoniella acicularis]
MKTLVHISLINFDLEVSFEDIPKLVGSIIEETEAMLLANNTCGLNANMTEEDIVQCRLKHIKIDNPPTYNALSYTWGDPKEPKVTINVDGHDLEVTRNSGGKLSDLSVLSVKGFRYATISMAFRLGAQNDDLEFWESIFASRILTKNLLDLLVHLKICDTHTNARTSIWDAWMAGCAFETASWWRPGLFDKWCAGLDSETKFDELDGIKEWIATSYVQRNRSLFVTDNNTIVKGRSTVKKGDIVTVILGCDVLLILRSAGSNFELIGDCYVDGIMGGEAIKDFEDGKVELETFDLQ